MRIWIASTELTGSSPKEWPQDLSINGRQLTQEGQFLRAVQVIMYARGNVKCTIGFSVTREHADVQACQVYLFDTLIDLPLSGVVKFEARNSAGAKRYFWFQAGVIDVVDMSQLGQSSSIRYSLSGGKPVREDPS